MSGNINNKSSSTFESQHSGNNNSNQNDNPYKTTSNRQNIKGEELESLMCCKKILDNESLKNNVKMNLQLANTEYAQLIEKILSDGQEIPDKPILKVELLSMNDKPVQYELVRKDIEEVFGKYGRITKADKRFNSVFVHFNARISTLMAKKALDGYFISDLGLKLKVEFYDPDCLEPEIQGQNEPNFQDHNKSNMSNCNGMLQNITNSTNITDMNSMFMKGLNASNSQKPLKIAANNVASGKFTCRYDIQIENDKDFQVAKKIIGAKGYNMKQIIDNAQAETGYDLRQESDLIKLRLRGRGSGFKEGPAKKESDEPLHLCVSAKYHEVYTNACKYVEQLLSRIYEEYKDHTKLNLQISSRVDHMPDVPHNKTKSENMSNKFDNSYSNFDFNNLNNQLKQTGLSKQQMLVNQNIVAQNLVAQNVLANQGLGVNGLVGNNLMGNNLTGNNLLNSNYINQGLVNPNFINQNLVNQGQAGQNLVGQNLVAQNLVSQNLAMNLMANNQSSLVIANSCLYNGNNNNNNNNQDKFNFMN